MQLPNVFCITVKTYTLALKKICFFDIINTDKLLRRVIMRVRLLKTIGIFVGAGIIFLSKTNTVASINPTRAYEARQKMVSLLDKEKHNEKVSYKYLAEQLCIYFNPPKFPDEELTFNTPFGVARVEIKSTKSVFITNGINEYTEIGKILDEVLTEEGRKRLAEIILEYLQTGPVPNDEYKTKTFNLYEFNDRSIFFDLKNKLCFSKLLSNNSLYMEKFKELKKLNKKIKKFKESTDLDLRKAKYRNKKEEIENLRNELDKLKQHQQEIMSNINDMNKKDEKLLKKLQSAANALCAILMVTEPNYNRSFDGGKHERALVRDVKNSGITYTEAFGKFVPSVKGGADLAREYSTNQDGSSEILESDYYSDDEDENEYDLEGLYNL